ncbi:hypothetical protein ASD24_24420 [Paenibacillus sp. Root52]|nr:hypothetical protein ASD24_24420 [Paenibacillus sp. Root52]
MTNQRIEKTVTILRDREPSDIGNVSAWRFDFIDEEGIEYVWNTTSDPDGKRSGEKWLVRMTVYGSSSVLGFPFKRVKRVFFVEEVSTHEK